MAETHSKLTDLASAVESTELSRRSLLKRVVLAGIGFPVFGSLIASCGDDDDGDDGDAEADEGESDEDTTDEDATADDADESDEDDESVEESDEDESDDDESGEVADGGDISVMWTGPNEGLSPFYGATGNTQQVMVMMYGAVVKMNDVLEPTPDLAETIDITEDAMQYTFELHDDVYFNDGEQLTSSDVRFTYETVIDQNTGSYWGPRLRNIQGATEYAEGGADSVEGIETPDDFTVILHMEEPFAVFLLSMTQFCGLGIAPEHVLADVPRDELEQHDFNWAPTVSAGPFQFGDYREDEYLELHRYEDYFRGTPAIERIFIRELDADAAVAQLETGELDLMLLPVDEIDRIEALDHVNIESVASPSVSFLTLNLTLERFQDKRVRQAMLYAIDREGIVESVLDGYGRVVQQTMIGPEWFDPSDHVTVYEYDPDRARALLEEAGWDSDQPVEILTNNTVDPQIRRAQTVIQQQWNEVGIQTDISYLESAAITERTQEVESWDWEIRTVQGGVFRTDPHISTEYFHSREWAPDGNNYGHYANDRVDELFDRGREVLAQEERIEIYQELAEILSDEAPWIYIYSPDSIFGVSTRLQGFQPPSYLNNKFWNVHEWSVSE